MTKKYSLSLAEHLPSVYLGEEKIRNKKVLKIHHVVDATIACSCCLVAKSCLTLCDPMDYIAHQTSLSMEFPHQEY